MSRGGPAESAVDRRLRGALAFSLVVAVALVASAALLPRSSLDDGASFALGNLTAALAAAGVFSIWALIAALLSVRPAPRHPLGKVVWMWALVWCVVLGVVGLTRPDNGSMASVLLYACGVLSLLSGAPGLTVAAIPPRARRDFYGREM